MQTFHICYFIEKFDGETQFCTGENIQAASYSEAELKFREKFGDKVIIYITEKSNLLAA
jgi:hypothetical protein